jgi:ribulose-phosphate 3-epimerase
MKQLAASLLGADPGNLERDMRQALDAGVQIIHLDAMDGHFAPNIAFGPDTVAALRGHTDAVFDVHLMLSEFDRYLDRYIDAGANWLTIHLEAGRHHHRHLAQIRSSGLKAGLALNPGTPVEAAKDLVDVIDVMLIMSVDPGFSGAKFIDHALSKVARADALRREHDADFVISVDGGVSEVNIPDLSLAGCNVFVMASAMFGHGSVAERVHILKQSIPTERAVHGDE